jgi:phytoene dehydrogenase-like protein
VKGNVIIVGGGISGLAASIYLARGGCNVTLFEKRQNLGGRSITQLRHGFRFNLGPRVLYRAGMGAKVYRELGVPVRGGVWKRSGIGLYHGERHPLPMSLFAVARTALLTSRGKWEAASLLLRIGRMNTRPYASMTIREWLDTNVSDARFRKILETLLRAATYSVDQRQSAAEALEQVKLILRGVLYVDEGWQKLVDGLHSHAVSAGVNFVTKSTVVGVDVDDRVRAIHLGGLEPHREEKGTPLSAETVLLAVDPVTAARLVGDVPFAKSWSDLTPATAACLDVALKGLPYPAPTFALSIDAPLYMSVHSAYAQLTPQNGALVHLAKYRSEPSPSPADEYDAESLRMTDEARRDEQELEQFFDQLQPGWRERVVYKRFFPSLTVTNAVSRPDHPRPPVSTPVRGLYLAGDWVGSEGSLADAALTSARAAAQRILAS